MEEFEDNIINHYTSDDDADVHNKVCTDEAKLCKKRSSDEKIEETPNEEL